MVDVSTLDKSWFAKVRWEILDMVGRVDDAGEAREDLRKRISRLSNGGRIPETTAQLMHLILSARNKAEYESRVYSGTDAKQLLSAWRSVKEWDSPNPGPVMPSPRQGSHRPSSQPDGLFHCPIPGCRKVFESTRGGWDAHVASYRKHPGWYPDVIDGEERKARFKDDFADWFGR